MSKRHVCWLLRPAVKAHPISSEHAALMPHSGHQVSQLTYNIGPLGGGCQFLWSLDWLLGSSKTGAAPDSDGMLGLNFEALRGSFLPWRSHERNPRRKAILTRGFGDASGTSVSPSIAWGSSVTSSRSSEFGSVSLGGRTGCWSNTLHLLGSPTLAMSVGICTIHPRGASQAADIAKGQTVALFSAALPLSSPSRGGFPIPASPRPLPPQLP